MMDRSTDKNTEKRKENKKTYRGRLVAAFVVVLVTTLLEIIYYGYHIMDNRDNVVHSFKNEQDSADYCRWAGWEIGGCDDTFHKTFCAGIRNYVGIHSQRWQSAVYEG